MCPKSSKKTFLGLATHGDLGILHFRTPPFTPKIGMIPKIMRAIYGVLNHGFPIASQHLLIPPPKSLVFPLIINTFGWILQPFDHFSMAPQKILRILHEKQPPFTTYHPLPPPCSSSMTSWGSSERSDTFFSSSSRTSSSSPPEAYEQGELAAFFTILAPNREPVNPQLHDHCRDFSTINGYLGVYLSFKDT